MSHIYPHLAEGGSRIRNGTSLGRKSRSSPVPRGMARRFAVPNPPEAQPKSLILRGMFNTGSTGFLLLLPMVPERFQLARERGRGPLSGGGDLDCERALLRVVCIPSTASAAGSCRYLQCATVVLALSAGPNDGSDDGDCRITPLSPGPPHVTCTTAPAQRIRAVQRSLYAAWVGT